MKITPHTQGATAPTTLTCITLPAGAKGVGAKAVAKWQSQANNVLSNALGKPFKNKTTAIKAAGEAVMRLLSKLQTKPAYAFQNTAYKAGVEDAIVQTAALLANTTERALVKILIALQKEHKTRYAA